MGFSQREKGKKRACENCATRWYDLNKNPIVCPVCKQQFEMTDLNILAFQNISYKDKNNSDSKLNNLETQESAESIEDNNEDEDIISLEEAEEEVS